MVCNLPMKPFVRPLVGLSVERLDACSVGWTICHVLLKGREVTLPTFSWLNNQYYRNIKKKNEINLSSTCIAIMSSSLYVCSGLTSLGRARLRLQMGLGLASPLAALPSLRKLMRAMGSLWGSLTRTVRGNRFSLHTKHLYRVSHKKSWVWRLLAATKIKYVGGHRGDFPLKLPLH